MSLFINNNWTGASRSGLICGLMMVTSCTIPMAKASETWDCAAPNEQFDKRSLEFSANSTSISGRIIFHEADYDDAWTSLAKITITSDNTVSGSCHCDALKVYAYKEFNNIQFYLYANGQTIGIAQSPFGTPIDFKVSIDANYVMTAEVGETPSAIQSQKLAHPEHDSIQMLCSGGKVSFLVSLCDKNQTFKFSARG